ncbi:kinase-like domain-containing protein [Gigaspora rosea]|uniref:Kinase-like domain-containing protein n=1 Tax=Gigaspora rosea TaxID=44941 RepID=A0A397VQM2_9GLOM|nr:kinase-like domain-containing protein [Gigaspora rosea]
MLKSDDQKSINSSSVTPLLESTSSELKQDPNHIMISPKLPPTIDMIELISKKSPMAEFPREHIMRLSFICRNGSQERIPLTNDYCIFYGVTELGIESADETVKAEYRRIAKEALRVRNEIELKLIGSGDMRMYILLNSGKQYAVKSLGNTLQLEYKEAMSFIHEVMLKILREVSHPNIIKFYGVYKDPHNFMLILQLANGGTLRKYLESKWKDGLTLLASQLKLPVGYVSYTEKKYAIEIWCVVDHSNNILINDGKILISDFGISKKMDSTTATSSIKGLPAYVEPRYYFYPDEKIKRDEKSDIYSLGVVFWELTSGTPPFSDSPNHAIIIKISQGKRETIIPGTPIDYAKLYMRCWDSEPEKRPTIEEILTELERLSKGVV